MNNELEALLMNQQRNIQQSNHSKEANQKDIKRNKKMQNKLYNQVPETFIEQVQNQDLGNMDNHFLFTQQKGQVNDQMAQNNPFSNGMLQLLENLKQIRQEEITFQDLLGHQV